MGFTPSSAVPLLSRASVAAPAPCSLGAAQRRLPDTLSSTEHICTRKGHASPQQKATSRPVGKAASILPAVVTNCFHRPRSLQ